MLLILAGLVVLASADLRAAVEGAVADIADDLASALLQTSAAGGPAKAASIQVGAADAGANANADAGAPTKVFLLECAGAALAAGGAVYVTVRVLGSGPIRRVSKSLQSFGAACAVLAVVWARRPELVQQVANPLGFNAWTTWTALLMLKVALLSLLDALVLRLVRGCVNPPGLHFRVVHPKVRGLAQLQVIDYFYLGVNQVIEYVFALNVVHYVLAPPDDGTVVSTSMASLGPINTAVALYLLFVVDDLFYAPAHYIMHWAPFYPYVHKHHHRQIVPRRGYADAGNEHPLEQVIGLSIVWATIRIVGRLCGLHAFTILVHFVLYAALALLNHTSLDVSFRVLGFDYSVGAHEMHHRNPDCNMAQYWMYLDRLMGTYRKYVPERPSAASDAPEVSSKAE